jgi:hypothetical protein
VTAVAAPPGTEVTRALGPLERWYWICDQVSPLNVVSRVELRGPLPDDALRAGLDALQERHPLLRVVIRTDAVGADPWYVPRAGRTIPLRRTPAPDGGWARMLDDGELNEPVDWRTGPLARAVVLSDGPAGDERHDLVLVLPHYLADGTTALTLVRQWVELAAAHVAGEPPDATRAPVRPGPEALLPAAHRGVSGVRRMVSQFARFNGVAALRRPRRFEAGTAVPFAERRTGLLHRELTGAEVDELGAACRREGTTVHGALAAAIVSAVAQDAVGSAPGRFTIGSPIDYRDQLEPPVGGTEMGTYVTSVATIVDRDPDAPLWDMARTVSDDLRRSRRRGDPLAAINTLRLLAPKTLADSDRFLRFMDAKGPMTLCLSNLGRVDVPGAVGPWRLGGAQFIASLSVNGLFVATVTTGHDGLACNFTYLKDAVPDERAARIADGSLAAVRSLLPGAAA